MDRSIVRDQFSSTCHAHVSQHVCIKCNKPVEVCLNRLSNFQKIVEEKILFRSLRKASRLKSFADANISVRNHFFLKNFVTSEGAVSHDVLFYQQLSSSRIVFLIVMSDCVS